MNDKSILVAQKQILFLGSKQSKEKLRPEKTIEKEKNITSFFLKLPDKMNSKFRQQLAGYFNYQQ